MLISQNWLKEFVDVSCSPKELSDILTMLGIEVESIQNRGAQFDGFVVGQVLRREKHPNADKLSVCEVTTDTDGMTRTIICGAPNVAVGQKVVVALEDAIVPNGGFTIARRKIRGIESNGMICSRAELGIGEDDGGIWVLPEDAIIGTPLADFLQMNDVIYEISVTPNRADCLSHLGIAREIAAYFATPLRKPEMNLTASTESGEKYITVEIRNMEDCPRYAGRVVTGIHVTESPEWLKNRLLAVGLRPRNVIVDITNLVLMECGHPLHAFDLDTLADRKIIVQSAEDNEKFTTLDSKERTLDSHMLMICDAEKPVAIAGVMGGENSEITAATTNVFIESAYFRPSSIRRTAKKLGISSDASYRFERGTDPDNVLYAADRAAWLMVALAGGTIVGEVVDVYPQPIASKIIRLRYSRVEIILGVHIPNEEIVSLLQRLDFSVVAQDEESVTVQAPTYRVDIGEEIDLIEEVARLYHYDNIEAASVSHLIFGAQQVPEKLAPSGDRQKLQHYLTENGFHEIFTQNMIDPPSAALFTAHPVRLANPLGEDLSVMRPSLIPSMLRVIERNIRFGQKDLRLFETGKIFHHADASSFIPGFVEEEELIVALCGSRELTHWAGVAGSVDFYDSKGILESIIEFLGIKDMTLEPMTQEHPILTPNTVVAVKNDTTVGYAGEVSPQILKEFDIDHPVYLCLLSLNAMQTMERTSRTYHPVSSYPTVSRDLAFIVNASLSAGQVQSIIQNNGGSYLQSVQVFDVFTGETVGTGKKSIAFALSFNSLEKTLQDAEVDESVAAIVNAVQSSTGGVLRA